MSGTLPAHTPDERQGGAPPKGLSPRKLARLELRLAAIEALVADGDDLASATREIFLGPLGPYTTEPPARTPAFWLAQHARLVKEVSPTLLDQATDRAGARVARLADAASTTLEQVVTGDFPHDRDGAAVARTMHEGARTVFEVLKMVKRPGGNVSVANQVAVAVSATEHSAAVQVRARQILEQHARWERERGRAEALGLPLPPRPVSDVRRIEDAHDESLEADATACVLDGAAPREDEGRSPAERPSGAMASDVGTVAQSPPVPLPGCPVRGADASHHAPRAGEQGADEVDEEVNRDGGDSS